MPVGLFRDQEGSVQVNYGTGATIPIPRSRYEANGYKPDFDKLPSEAEYWAAEKKKAAAAFDSGLTTGANPFSQCLDLQGIQVANMSASESRRRATWGPR